MNVICPHCKQEVTKVDIDTQGGGLSVRHSVISCPNCHTILGVK